MVKRGDICAFVANVHCATVILVCTLSGLVLHGEKIFLVDILVGGSWKGFYLMDDAVGCSRSTMTWCIGFIRYMC